MNEDSVAELLAGLTASGRWGESFSGNGPTRRLAMRPADIAAALAGVKPDTTADLLLTLYCGHPVGSLSDRLVEELRPNRALALGAKASDDRLRAIIALALADVLAPVVCPSCQGRGWVRDRVPCATCGSVGHTPKQRAAALAAMFGVSKSTWSECWSWRYQIVFRVLNQRVADGLFQLRKALGR